MLFDVFTTISVVVLYTLKLFLFLEAVNIQATIRERTIEYLTICFEGKKKKLLIVARARRAIARGCVQGGCQSRIAVD